MPVPTQLPTKLSIALLAQAFRRTMSRERERSASPPPETRALIPSLEGFQPCVRRVLAAASYPAMARKGGTNAARMRFRQ